MDAWVVPTFNSDVGWTCNILGVVEIKALRKDERGDANLIPWLIFLSGFVIFSAFFITDYVNSVYAHEEAMFVGGETVLDVPFKDHAPKSGETITSTRVFENMIYGHHGLVIGYWPWYTEENDINMRIQYLIVKQEDGETLLRKSVIEDVEDIMENNIFTKRVIIEFANPDLFKGSRTEPFRVTSIVESIVENEFVTFNITVDYLWEWGFTDAMAAIATFSIPYVPTAIAAIIAVPFWVVVSYIVTQLVLKALDIIIPG